MANSQRKARLTTDGLRREIVSQIDRAMKEASQISDEADERVHRVRRRSKRLRAELRLLRPIAHSESRMASRHIRKASNALSPFRDAQIIPSALNAVLAILREPTAIDHSDVLEWLMGSADLTRPTAVSLSEQIEIASRQLKKARAAVLGAKLKPRRKLGSKDLATGYEGGRRAVEETLRDHNADSFHELRKAVKSHFYQCRFMKSVAPEVLPDRIESAKQLGDALGEAQDIVVLQEHCRGAIPTIDATQVDAFVQRCERIAVQRRNAALANACQQFFLTTDDFVASLEHFQK